MPHKVENTSSRAALDQANAVSQTQRNQETRVRERDQDRQVEESRQSPTSSTTGSVIDTLA
jgi:hypothetical protein